MNVFSMIQIARSIQILENIIPDMSNILRCIYKYEAQKICMKVNEEQKTFLLPNKIYIGLSIILWTCR